jgi:hypothetical protein
MRHSEVHGLTKDGSCLATQVEATAIGNKSTIAACKALLRTALVNLRVSANEHHSPYGGFLLA